MYSGRHLLVLSLLEVFAAHGLQPAAMDPWRSWVAFKQFARSIAEEPDPGVSVQVNKEKDGGTNLFFLRQAFDPTDSQIEPVGGVVCEFNFPANGPRNAQAAWWSFDHGTFERFVDGVEQDQVIADLFVRAPTKSSVYWEEA